MNKLLAAVTVLVASTAHADTLYVDVLGCPAAGSCFVPHGNPGCDDAKCCATVCAADPFCCNLEWTPTV